MTFEAKPKNICNLASPFSSRCCVVDGFGVVVGLGCFGGPGYVVPVKYC